MTARMRVALLTPLIACAANLAHAEQACNDADKDAPCHSAPKAETQASSNSPVESDLLGWSATIENDLFSPGQSTDRWYTNGLHGAWAYKPEKTPASLHGWQHLWSRFFGKWGASSSGDRVTVSMSVGQNMYTPRRIDTAAAQPLDRPWAGFFYGGLGAYQYSMETPSGGKHGYRGFHEAVDLKVGVIGPASLAGQVQRGWHHLINAPQPQGWHNQVRPQLGVQMSYRYTWRYSMYDNLRVHPFAGATLGNTRTQAVAGATVHFGGAGHLISDADEGDFSTLDFSDAERSNRSAKWGAYVQLAAKRVAYNRFLTGPVYGTAPQIELTRNVATLSLGVMLELRSDWRVSYAIKRRSPEFSSPALNRNDAYQTWGGITLIRDLR